MGTYQGDGSYATLVVVDNNAESVLREAIFEHLDHIVRERGVVTRDELWDFHVNGEVHHLVDRSRGIRNPSYLSGTLSIMSDTNSEYADEDLDESLFAYSYRKGSNDGDNRKLRQAIELKLPLILFRKISPSIYVPIFPVYAVADDVINRRFLIALDATLRDVSDPLNLEPLEKRYAERVTKQRLHQPEFRGRILHAYKTQCAICNLKHGDLLDAAHIIRDGRPDGTPTVNNGLSLCKIHHAAYDLNHLGISPDYKIEINAALMDEEDGPMLRHGLQEMNGRPLFIPSKRADRPSPDRLAERYQEFKSAS